MADPTHDEGRPPAKERPHYVTAGDILSVQPRCLLCRHQISSDASIRAGVGTNCRRRLRRLALEAVDPKVLRDLFSNIIEQVARDTSGRDVFAQNAAIERADRERLAELARGWSA